MDRAPLNIYRLRLTIDGSAEYVEHASKNVRTDGCLKRSTGILDMIAPGQTLGRRQRDAAYTMRIEQHQHLDRDFLVLSSSQKRVNWRYFTIKDHLYDAATDGDDDPMP